GPSRRHLLAPRGLVDRQRHEQGLALAGLEAQREGGPRRPGGVGSRRETHGQAAVEIIAALIEAVQHPLLPARPMALAGVLVKQAAYLEDVLEAGVEGERHIEVRLVWAIVLEGEQVVQRQLPRYGALPA